MMQIKELLLYGYNGKVRHLPFALGRVNIITGKSKSGKSAVGDIIDYCLGGSSCSIADGVVRENVAWYGLVLQFDDERIFIARKNPNHGQQSTELCYIDVGKDLTPPNSCNFSSNINIGGIEEILSRRLGISENINTPPESQSRRALEANIRHALFYCFQGQDEIAARNFLFHHQSEDFVTQAIKDTLPYFLGVISEDALALENERAVLKRRLIIEKRKFEETCALIGSGTERAIALLNEAYRVGLVRESLKAKCNDYNSIQDALQSLMNWTPEKVGYSSMDQLTALQSELESCHHELEEIELSLSNARLFIGETSGYYQESQHQELRLESIGLFNQLDFNVDKCPFCSSKISTTMPSLDMMKISIVNLDKSISSVTREQPRIREFINNLEQKRQKTREHIIKLESSINGIYTQEDERRKIRDLNARKARVVGRISLWLESVEEENDANTQNGVIRDIEKRLGEIDTILDRESLNDRKQSSLSRLQVDMTEWAKELCLEHSNNPYRLDMNKATVIVDKPDRPVPLKQLGSGSNWVGIHLITYFALQKFFINAHRPVPNFIFLDQPSQVYFPSPTDEEKIDLLAVSRIYDFIINRVAEANGMLQVIIVDHANFTEKAFCDLVIEDWWIGDNNLVPMEWYMEK